MRSLKFEGVPSARRRARRALPRVVFDFVDGAADDEMTAGANVAAYSAVTLAQRATLGVIRPRIATTVVGQPLKFPLITAPCGFVRVVNPEGEIGVARAAESAGVISVLSTMAGTGMQEVAGAVADPSRVWFQLYHLGGRSWADRLVDQAEEAGVGALVVTIDTAVGGNRERDSRNRVPQPLSLTARTAARHAPGMLLHPMWLARFLRDGAPIHFPNAPSVDEEGMPVTQVDAQALMAKAPPTWDDLVRLRGRWKRPLLVKGIMSPEDGRRCVDIGADAVIVSNHGGRQLDSGTPTLQVLPEVVEAVGDGAEVLLDGGITRATDIIKAVSLGARAVLVGRAYLWALACGGEAGVRRILEILRTEMVRDMILMGCRDIGELDLSWLRPAGSSMGGCLVGRL